MLNMGAHLAMPNAMRPPDLSPDVRSFVNRVLQGVQQARDAMADAQHRQRCQANRRRRNVFYRTGDLVLLSAENLNLYGSGSHKLRPKWVGPFPVTHAHGVNVKLQLPAESGWQRIHPIPYCAVK
jgi:hypothetical protein